MPSVFRAWYCNQFRFILSNSCCPRLSANHAGGLSMACIQKSGSLSDKAKCLCAMDRELKDGFIEWCYEHAAIEPWIRNLPCRSLNVTLHVQDSIPAQELLLAVFAPVLRCTQFLLMPTRAVLSSMVPKCYRSSRR